MILRRLLTKHFLAYMTIWVIVCVLVDMAGVPAIAAMALGCVTQDFGQTFADWVCSRE